MGYYNFQQLFLELFLEKVLDRFEKQAYNAYLSFGDILLTNYRYK